MKTLLSLILCALCASAFSLTIGDCQGRWTIDIEASWPQLEAFFRQQAPPDTSADALAARMAEFKQDMVDRFFEFTEKTVSTYRREDGAKVKNEELQVTGLTAEPEALTIATKEVMMKLTKRGDQLVMLSSEVTEPGVQGKSFTIILKRAADEPPAPAPKP